jgi:hypothetical protein
MHKLILQELLDIKLITSFEVAKHIELYDDLLHQMNRVIQIIFHNYLLVEF